MLTLQPTDGADMLIWRGRMKAKENQRVMLTKQLLSDAFLQMLKETPIHAISIRQLCERAGINRTTFYHHYGSQYDLLSDISGRFLDEIDERLSAVDAENRESVQERVTMVLEYFDDNPELSRMLLNNNLDPQFAERIFALPRISDLLQAALKNCTDPCWSRAVTSFAIHGSYRLLQEWIDQDDRLAPEEQAGLILSLARRVCH